MTKHTNNNLINLEERPVSSGPRFCIKQSIFHDVQPCVYFSSQVLLLNILQLLHLKLRMLSDRKTKIAKTLKLAKKNRNRYKRQFRNFKKTLNNRNFQKLPIFRNVLGFWPFICYHNFCMPNGLRWKPLSKNKIMGFKKLNHIKKLTDSG